MKLNDSFEIVDVAGEHIVVPISNAAKVFNGVIAVTDAVAYLLKNSHEDKSEQDLVRLLMLEYDVDYEKAQKDVHTMIEKLMGLGILNE